MKENSPSGDPDAAPANARKAMRDKDVLTALLLIGGSIALIAYSLSISLRAMRVAGAEFYTAPGFFLLWIATALLVLSAALLAAALRQGGDLRWLAPRRLLQIARNKAFVQTWIVFIYLYLYMCFFWERVPWLGWRVPFWLSSFVFMAAMMATFSRKKAIPILAISAIAAAAIDFAFRHLAMTPLP